MLEIEKLKKKDINFLLDESWKIRKNNFNSKFFISTPGAKTFISDFHSNKKNYCCRILSPIGS